MRDTWRLKCDTLIPFVSQPYFYICLLLSLMIYLMTNSLMIYLKAHHELNLNVVWFLTSLMGMWLIYIFCLGSAIAFCFHFTYCKSLVRLIIQLVYLVRQIECRLYNVISNVRLKLITVRLYIDIKYPTYDN